MTGASLEGAPRRPTMPTEQHHAVRWTRVDLRDQEAVAQVVDAARPDAVFHLAGVAFVPTAGDDPAAAWAANVLPAVALMAILQERRHAGALDPVVVVAGSAEQYGAQPASAQPIVESALLLPRTTYAATKVAQEAAVLTAWRSSGVRVVATRPFNHSGPGQSPSFLLPALVQRALAARASGAATVPLGNLTPMRDFSHVSDVAAAYVALARWGVPGETYNISSGVGHAVGDLVSLVLERTGTTAQPLADPELQRAVDVPMLVGDSTKLRATTGWATTHDVAAIIDDLINAPTY